MGAFFVIIGLIIGGFIGIAGMSMFIVGKEDSKMDEFYRKSRRKHDSNESTKKTKSK